MRATNCEEPSGVLGIGGVIRRALKEGKSWQVHRAIPWVPKCQEGIPALRLHRQKIARYSMPGFHGIAGCFTSSQLEF